MNSNRRFNFFYTPLIFIFIVFFVVSFYLNNEKYIKKSDYDILVKKNKELVKVARSKKELDVKYEMLLRQRNNFPKGSNVSKTN